MTKIILLSIAFFISGNNSNAKSSFTNCNFLIGRGVEVRYIKVDNYDEKKQKEIKVDEVVYPLFKTKELAYNHVKNMAIKKDLTIVYVVSVEVKEFELLDIAD